MKQASTSACPTCERSYHLTWQMVHEALEEWEAIGRSAAELEYLMTGAVGITDSRLVSLLAAGSGGKVA